MRAFLDFYTMRIPGGLSLNFLVYYFLLLSCWGYALWRGGAPERIGTTILVVFSLLTTVAISSADASYTSVETGVLVVDLICSAAFLALAMRADRFWPLWVAALQILGTAGHGIKFVDPEILRRTYAIFIIVWSYPMIALFVVGTWRHRARVARFGFDNPWSDAKGG